MWSASTSRAPPSAIATPSRRCGAREFAVNLHYIPVHTQPYFARMGLDQSACPESLKYYAEAMTLPLYRKLTEAEQDHVAAALAKILAE